MLPVPIGRAHEVAIYDHCWRVLTAEERNDPQRTPATRRPGTSSSKINTWSASTATRAPTLRQKTSTPTATSCGDARPGAPLVWVLEYIANIIYPLLMMPPPQPRQVWEPRRQGFGSSSSRSSSSPARNSPYATPCLLFRARLATVKSEPDDSPPHRRSGGGARAIHERRTPRKPSPPCGHLRFRESVRPCFLK